jgi:succinyl-diaminopimelate desuccinylase
MTINWQEEINNRKDDLMKDLFTLLSVNSVRDDSKATADAPVGPGPKEALEVFLKIADRDGFTTKNVDNLAGHAEYGEGDETLGVLAHVDVVPVDDKWDTDPFKPEVRDERIYARGASDDKGPLMAAYYGLKVIKELGLPVAKRVRFIVGTDEESEWKGVTRYFEVEDKPDFGFSPDADFPIINGEKGMYSAKLLFEKRSDKLVSFEGGLRENMVPGEAHAVVTGIKENADQIIADFQAANPDITIITSQDNDEYTISVEGKGVHAMNPSIGFNAATFLAKLLLQLDDDLAKDDILRFLGELVHEDFYGERLGIAHEDEIMGTVTVNPGLVGEEDGKLYTVLNIRVPRGKEYSEIDATFAKHGETYHYTFVDGTKTNKKPHYVPADDPLVQTLLAVYENQTGEKGHERSIGGGTYGRLLERGVAYGALFPDSIDTMHQANEFLAVRDLLRSASIYAEAIYELIKPEEAK